MDLHQTVLETAQEMLDRDDLTLDDDFFEMGGDSLVGMRFVSRIGRAVDVPVRMTLLFVHPILGEFAAEVDSLVQRQSSAEPGVEVL